jgi:hypothetical protein
MYDFTQIFNGMNTFVLNNFYKKENLIIIVGGFVLFVIITSSVSFGSNESSFSLMDNKPESSFMGSAILYLIVIFFALAIINDYHTDIVGFKILKPFITFVKEYLEENGFGKQTPTTDETTDETIDETTDETTDETIDETTDETTDATTGDSVALIDQTDIPAENATGEVFNIATNKYTYSGAKAVCAAYDSRLATYKEVENAYNNKGEWCNYGWSADQMALFPTQQQTYDYLQTTENHKHSCGRPGVNGGFMEDENLEFGVNCYGTKPVQVGEGGKDIMFNNGILSYPMTKEEQEINEQTSTIRDDLSNILIYPFNGEKWSN